MEKLGYTTTETLLWDYSETEQYYVLAIPPARTVKTLYLVTWEYAFQWFGLNGGNNLKIVYYPFSQIHFRNLTNPCACAPEVFTIAASIAVSPSSVDEDSGTALIYTITLDDTSAFDTEITYNVGGTATAGVDYTATFINPITILAGQNTATITVIPVEDLTVEDNETVIVTLISGTSGTNIISANGSATGTIVDKTVAPLMPAWQWPLSIIPDAPIWQYARASTWPFSKGPWIAGVIGGSPAVALGFGTITQQTSVHTGTLPTGRVTGDLLIFYFKIRSTTNDPTLSAGWTLLDSFGYGGSTFRYGVAYRFVTGAEAAPTLTWAGGGTAVSMIAEYSGADATTPLVAGSKNGASTGTTISSTAINSTRNNSLAISASWDDLATAPTLPAGFTNEGVGFYQNVFGSLRLCDVRIPSSGSSSGAVSCTQGSSVQWGTFLFELKAA